jgi:uncharacterized protein YlxW (UPF0749 family)
MCRKLAAFVVAGVLAGGVVASNLTPAAATHTLGHLRRQISRLENQVSTLQTQVRKLNNEVYTCERLADYQVTDPTTAQPVTDTFVVYTC